jgi:acyl dehydratase
MNNRQILNNYAKESAMTPQELATKVGETIGTSEWAEMSQERINTFADATGDHQFIHVDPAKAAMTPFGGTIAHGFLTLSMIPYLSWNSDMPAIDGIKMAVNYGGNKTRFISPVKSGKRIRGHWKLVELVEKRPGQWQQTVEVTIEIEGEDKPALICEWITMLFV